MAAVRTIRLLAAFVLWLAIGAVVQFAPRNRTQRRVDAGGPT